MGFIISRGKGENPKKKLSRYFKKNKYTLNTQMAIFFKIFDVKDEL